ncbi:MAG: 16S rRNA (cytosine(1402)-N(4))-methyltransferase RsmH, partial [Chloroflexi bacterium]|nr:16S rRNA (cytosine(1402)-N(4))-methyltransferase RsmH [Chloroflexota bacterium]
MIDVAEGTAAFTHVPVLSEQVLTWLLPSRPIAGARFIDATVGLGGHAEQLLQRLPPDSRLLALDADPQALARARIRLAPFGERVTYAQGRHPQLGEIARQHGFGAVQGILFDLGASSMQLDDPARGFSFAHEGPLDMRMGPDVTTTAAEIVNTWDARDLEQIIRDYGEERYARRVARAIVAARPLHTTTELARVVASSVY